MKALNRFGFLPKWAAAGVAVLAMLEVGFRVLGVGVAARGVNNNLAIRRPVDASEAPKLGDTLRPGASGSVTYPGYDGKPDWTIEYAINAQGFRDKSYPMQRQAGSVRIAVLGDSVTYGTGVPAEETYPKVLERKLNATFEGSRFEVMNCGVYAHNTSQQVAWFRFNVRRYQPDLVVICSTLPDASGANVETAEREPSGRIRAVRALGLTSGVWDKAEAENADPAVRRMQWLRRTSRVADFVAHRTYAWLMRDETAASYRADWAQGSPGRKLVGDSLRALKADSIADGFDVRVAMVPTLIELNDHYPFAEQHAALADICRRLELPFIDLFDEFKGRDAASLRVHVHDRHPNAMGHQLIADGLFDSLVESIRARTPASDTVSVMAGED